MAMPHAAPRTHGRRSGQESGGGTDWCEPTFSSWGSGGRCKPRKQTQFGKHILKINLKSGLISVSRHAVRDCEKVVDIWMLDIENDRLVMSLVYSAIYAQLPVSRIESTANRVCTGQSSDSERAHDQWQCAAVTPKVNLIFSFVSCISKLLIVGIVVSAIAVFKLVDNILSSSLHC